MRELSLILVFLVTLFSQSSDSPHGENFELSCDDCHTSEGWTVDQNNITFDHNLTNFHLDGLHSDVKCISCHSTLVFSEADPQCMTCHTDMHQETVGLDCARCHTTYSWIVSNITEIHQVSRFPLLGAHITADCYDCHESASLLQFEPLGVECIDCHMTDYQAATSPNHLENNYSTECTDCHNMNAFTWTGANFTHNLFPLTLGHSNVECSQCHTGSDYSNISPECFSCHEADYNAATSPNHQQADLSTECTECHTTNPGWKPADFTQHDNVFPIYSGEHHGEWSSCTDCHTDPGNYSIFTCIDCHEHNKNEMDDEHQGIGGYLYSSPACLDCHPTGSGEGSFNHATSIFPLTGAHVDTECASCHTTGYSGTPTDCFDCHMPDYNQTTNPSHVEIELTNDCASCHTTDPGWIPATFDVHNEYYLLDGGHLEAECASCHVTQYSGTSTVCFDCHLANFNETTNPNHVEIDLSNECETCHTTAPGWTPATFDVHNQYYVLVGAHTIINCSSCHETQYSGTPNTCVGCHLEEYNQTNDPPHASAQFSTDCLTCHSENAWEPATFDHDGEYFPIYSGEHNGEWNSCIECHTIPSNYALFSCIDCHDHNKADMDDEHQGISGYVYNSPACFECHPDGTSVGAFNHNNSNFPLTGEHTNTDCISCHANGYSGTSTVCFDCHSTNFNQSSNPNHVSLGFSNECNACHTTQAGWTPAQLTNHNDYYQLSGAHANISSDCFVCHQGNYNTTPNTCIDCHLDDYNQTNNPPHAAAQFSTECLTCHTENAWVPSTFDHDNQYFPIYSGKHDGEWNQCSDCHTVPSNYGLFSCIDCHEHNKSDMDNEHSGVSGYLYNSVACLDCHPDGSDKSFMLHNKIEIR